MGDDATFNTILDAVEAGTTNDERRAGSVEPDAVQATVAASVAAHDP